MLCPGITGGEIAFVAAMVTKDVRVRTIVRGNPARVIGVLADKYVL